MNFNRATILISILLIIIIGMIVGCGDDDSITDIGPNTGTIGISPNPSSINAPWSIAGPDEYTNSGNGDATLRDVPAGEYTLTWGEVEGWVTPPDSPRTLTLDAGSIVWFSGSVYVEVSDPGTVIVNPEPDNLSANWVLSLPSGVNVPGSGDSTLVEMPVGIYEITWVAEDGYNTPSATPTELVANGEIAFNGTYIPGSLPGTIEIVVIPEGLEAGWVLTRPDDSTIEGIGYTILEDMSPGRHWLEWLPVQDWNEPAPNPASFVLFSNAHVTIQSEYLNMFATIDGGSFQMGDIDSLYAAADEWPRHSVSITNPFEIGTSEVTQAQYQQVMGYNPSSDQDDSSFPVTNVSWYNAVEFCNALSLQEGRTPAYSINGTDVSWNQAVDGYRLPTEAEWEYVCRAGGQSDFCFGDLSNEVCNDLELGNYAWYCSASLSRTRHASKLPNDFGVYGMHGNVWEWCWDWYSDYSEDAQTDPIGPGIGQTKVVRGGSYLNRSVGCRSSNRASAMPNEDDTRNSTKGFRVIRQ
jgi:formylglycine-generating enzyme required for sulfatase activity